MGRYEGRHTQRAPLSEDDDDTESLHSTLFPFIHIS